MGENLSGARRLTPSPRTDEKNARQKEMIHAKAKEYMERAEKLKQHLADNDPANKKKPSAMGANGKASNGSGKGGCVRCAGMYVVF